MKELYFVPEYNRKQAEEGATTDLPQGIISDSDNIQKSVARYMPHTKEQIKSEGSQRTLGPQIDIMSNTPPIYMAHTK